jgi:hypothetical protein
MFTYVKKYYKSAVVLLLAVAVSICLIYAKNVYSNADFAKEFGSKTAMAENKLQHMETNFALCAKQCHTNAGFLQSIVFPEVMRYNSLKDGIEAESLRTLYVLFGEEYADFSIGIFQMKPTFAAQVETKAKQLLTDSVYQDLQLNYSSNEAENIRRERVIRLQDEEWQLVYLTAFVSICNNIYKNKHFLSQTEKLQWYATVYNAGFNKTDEYIHHKISQDNFYLSQNMPGKKFKYAAIAAWYYNQHS